MAAYGCGPIRFAHGEDQRVADARLTWAYICFMRRKVFRPLWVILALLLLLEAWLWDHLEPIVARIVNLITMGQGQNRSCAMD